MLKPPLEKSFFRFPYPENFEDGASNIGIPLFIEPDRIEEIQELQPFPDLKQAVLALNTNANSFVSLGIGIWEQTPEVDYCGGYIDIGCLDTPFTHTPAFMRLDEAFFAWLPSAGYSQQQAEYLKAALGFWEYHPTKILQNEASWRVCIWAQARSTSDLAAMLNIVVDFFCSLP